MIVNKPKKKRKAMSRYTIVKLVVLGIFTIIAVRVLYIQVYKHSHYKDVANENATRFIAEAAPRGEILDDKGNILATNREIYNLTYTMPSTGENDFYTTMNLVFKVLKDNDETLEDDMLLKIDKDGKFYFSYKNTSVEAQEYEKIRFLRDRGMNEKIQHQLFTNEKKAMTDEQNSEINQKLLQVTPEQAFEYLVKTYNLIELICPKPIQPSKGATKAQTKEYKEKLNKYNEEIKQYNQMTGSQQLAILLKKYPIQELRNYVVVKDAMKMQSFKGYRSVVIANNIKKSTAFIIYQKLNELPGIDVNLQPVRDYPYNNLAASVLGYVSPISSTNKDEYELRGYDVATDLVGKAGIEQSYEDLLKGVKGGKTVKVNSQGRVTENLFSLASSPGDNVHLTINKNVQYATQEALKDTINHIRTSITDNQGHTFPNATRGAALVVDVHNGNILAMASYPDYNPNIFAIPGQLTKDEYQQYFDPNLQAFGEKVAKMPGVTKTVDELFPKSSDGYRNDKYDLYPKPFYNYATLGAIPPGSIFKPLTAVAALQEGVTTPSEQINATGKFNIHPDVFGKSFAPECWIYSDYGGGHGPTNVEKALQVSCNFYFYEMGYRLYEHALKTTDLKGVEAKIYALNSLARWAWKFGLGHDPNSQDDPTTGIEIGENTNGQVYNFESYKKNAIQFAKFNLNDYLTSGDFKGVYKFAPFDFGVNKADSQELSDLKIKLKKDINDRLQVVGTTKPALNYDEFYKEIFPIVEQIMKVSPTYKESLANYQKTHSDATLESQAKIVTKAITQFTVMDEPGEILSPGQLIYAAIGQGINHFTPIQLASYISTLANGGTRYKLHLVNEITAPDGKVIKKIDPQILEQIKLKQSTINAVHEGMRRANDAESGTAESVFGNFPIETAGKTGTADYADNQREFGRSPYATYISFAPYKDPQIAFVGVIYDGGHGGYTANVARAAYEAYFKDILIKDYPQYVKSSSSFKKYVLDAPKDNYPGSAQAEADKAKAEAEKAQQEQILKDFNNN